MQNKTTTRNIIMKQATECSSPQVRFQEEPSVCLVQPPSEEERLTRWYSPKDLQKEDSQEFSRQEARQFKELRHQFVESLLAQQYENEKMGIDDPKGLFQLSRAGSKYSRQRAMKSANKQAEEAKKIGKENTTIGLVDSVLDLLDDEDF